MDIVKFIESENRAICQPKMELKIRKLAIIAGDGNLPIELINECEKQNKIFFVIIINGHGQKISKLYNPDFVMHLSKIGRSIKFARSKNITDLVMAGSIKETFIKRYDPRFWTAKFLTKYGAKISGDNSILASLARELEKEGFNILAPEDITKNTLCPMEY